MPDRAARYAVWSVLACVGVKAMTAMAWLAIILDVDVFEVMPSSTLLQTARTGALASLPFDLMAGLFTLHWIYRSSAFAQQISGDRTIISPGWAVGWFFIPILWLWQAFVGVRECYQACVLPEDPDMVPVPVVLRIWWGCWIAHNVLGALGFILTRDTPLLLGGFRHQMLVAQQALAVMLGLLMIRVIRLVRRAQAAVSTIG